MGIYALDKLISETRRLAAEYRRATGKTLPVSAEIAIHDGIRLLGLEPVEGADHGYDALRRIGDNVQRIQIKGRAVFNENKPAHRLGQLSLDKPWDRLVLVIMNEDYETVEIYEAERAEVEACLDDNTGSKRHRRGAMSVAQFKIISQRVWTRENGLEDDGFWDNRTST
jgi:hypothetical protein